MEDEIGSIYGKNNTDHKGTQACVLSASFCKGPSDANGNIRRNDECRTGSAARRRSASPATIVVLEPIHEAGQTLLEGHFGLVADGSADAGEVSAGLGHLGGQRWQ